MAANPKLDPYEPDRPKPAPGKPDKKVTLTVSTLSGDHTDEFPPKQKLKVVVEKAIKEIPLEGPGPWILEQRELSFLRTRQSRRPASRTATCSRSTPRRAAVDPAACKKVFDDEVMEMRAQSRFTKSWPILSADYPDLVVELPHSSGARRRFRFRCDDWDDQAPSVKSVDVHGKDLLNDPVGALFSGLLRRGPYC